MRHGHVSTLRIWPAQRPLAACRAALLAMLLPDPGDGEAQRKLLMRMAGCRPRRTGTGADTKAMDGLQVDLF